MSFKEWYEEFYEEKWEKEFVTFDVWKDAEKYEKYCNENKIKPVWDIGRSEAP